MGTEAVPGPDNEHVLKTDDGKKKHGTDYSRRSCGDKYAHAGLLLLRRPLPPLKQEHRSYRINSLRRDSVSKAVA
jgi:hypothetical protein